MFIRSGYSAHTRSSGTEDHHPARDVVDGRLDLPHAERSQARFPRLAFELGRRQAVELDAIVADLAPTVLVDDFAAALEDEMAGLEPHRGRLAAEQGPLELEQVRQRCRAAVTHDERLEMLGDRDRQHATGTQVPPGRLQERSTP